MRPRVPTGLLLWSLTAACGSQPLAPAPVPIQQMAPSPPEPAVNVFRAGNPTPNAPVEIELISEWTPGMATRYEAAAIVKVQDTGRPDAGLRVTVRGRAEVVEDPEGMAVRWYDHTVHDARPVLGAVVRRDHAVLGAVAAVTAALDRTDRVTLDGEWLGLAVTGESLEDARGRAVDATTKVVLDELARRGGVMDGVPEVLGRELAASTSAALLEPILAQQWTDRLGAWVGGGAWTLGETRRSVDDDIVPFVGGGPLTLVTEHTLARREPCPGPDPMATCVVLRATHVADPDQATAALKVRIEDRLAALLPTAHSYPEVHRVSITSTTEIIALPSDLIPMKETVHTTVEILAKVDGRDLRRVEEQSIERRLGWSPASTARR